MNLEKYIGQYVKMYLEYKNTVGWWTFEVVDVDVVSPETTLIVKEIPLMDEHPKKQKIKVVSKGKMAVEIKILNIPRDR